MTFVEISSKEQVTSGIFHETAIFGCFYQTLCNIENMDFLCDAIHPIKCLLAMSDEIHLAKIQ